MARRIVDYMFRTAKDDVGPRFKSLDAAQSRFLRKGTRGWQGYERTAKRSLSNVSRHGRQQFRLLGREAKTQLVQVVSAAALGVAVKKSITDFSNLGSEMTGVAIKMRQPVESLEDVRKELLAFSLQAGITTDAEDMAKGVNLLVGADFKLADSLFIVKAAAKGAAVAQTDAATVTSGLADIMGGFDIPGSRAAEIMSKMIVAADKGRVEIPALSGAIGTLIAPAKKAGAGIDTVLGLLETLSIKGVSNSAEASTAIAALFRRIADTEFKEKAQRFGIKVFDDSGNFREVPDILADIKKKMDKLDNSEKQLKFLDKLFGQDIRAGRALLPLLDNLDVAKRTIAEIANASGRLPEAFAQSARRTKAKLARFRNIFDVFSIEAGSLFAPGIDMLSEALLVGLNPVKDGKTFADHIRKMIQIAGETAEKEQWGLKFWRLVLIDPISDSVSSLSKKGGVVGGFLQRLIFDELIARERQKKAKKQTNEVLIGGKKVVLSKKQKGEAPIVEQIRGRIIANAAQANFHSQQQELRREGKQHFIFRPNISINQKIDAATGKTQTEIAVSDPNEIERRHPIGATP